MFIRWRAYDPTVAAFEQLRRRMDRLFEEYGRIEETPSFYEARWPYIDLRDAGDKLLLVADVPGMAEADLHVSLNQDVLSLAGERKAEAPEGYAVHRKERSSIRFSRSLTLPCKVDPEKVGATIKNGVLTIELHKAPEAQPRQIAVKAHG